MGLPIPSHELQYEFGRRLDVVDRLKAVERMALDRLNMLVNTLQHRAFLGEWGALPPSATVS